MIVGHDVSLLVALLSADLRRGDFNKIVSIKVGADQRPTRDALIHLGLRLQSRYALRLCIT